jgi:hypothetical protein
MLAKYVFVVLALAFLAAGILRGGLSRAQSRTWLLIGLIFGAVSGWLWSCG